MPQWFESKAREAWPSASVYSIGMILMTAPADSMLDDATCWAAFLARDRAMDGRFVGCVATTGIYCKPSCAARHPRRENMRFLPDPTAARAAGFRACLRCRPDEVGRDRIAVAAARALIEAAEDAPRLEAIAAHVGYAPHHFHRLFKRETGLTPAAYARALRADRLKAALDSPGSVTSAIYAAGYNAPSRAYVDADRHLGMTPSAWKDGGRGALIRWRTIDSSLGPLLVAATARGLCRISFGEGEAELSVRFPNADLQPADATLDQLAEAVLALVDHPGETPDLRLRHRLPASRLGRAARHPVGRNAQLQRGRGRDRSPASRPRGGQRLWRQCAGGPHPLPPRPAQRRDPGRLCLGTGPQAGIAGAGKGRVAGRLYLSFVPSLGHFEGWAIWGIGCDSG
jgi:AraC family transcriptional regulator of adaptative response/methylated-DNA-[protein]-cysteine methyltransferase